MAYYNNNDYYVNPPAYHYVRDCVYTFQQPAAVINIQQHPLVFNQHVRDEANFRRQNYYNERRGYAPTEQIASLSEGGGYSIGYEPQRYLEYNYGGYSDYHEQEREASVEKVEIYAPLCCDKCQRKVENALELIEGVTTVTADQWEKKVVVSGYNLNPRKLLKRVHLHKSGAVFWSDRPN
ncbi:uncharacterized protein [Physcomitrium patens]|uniref:HMA domain-containing protein n=1 Tax=Physcomitrium patens TaxID=3218 RepID=A0A2K1KD19_PHYPA|nr:uncharacterized protein LOC112285086 [Physcomitrium patens]PNR51639.1 hypothetical protein PHYPA_010826 [Physcomitrium patens]|eukprot:XP_024381387.1 uncharacterized protein LOC112285086 [Physcomitrella patens]